MYNSKLFRSFSGLIIIALLAIATSCQNKADVVIKGQILNLESKAKVVILRQDFSKTVPIDSFSVSTKKDKFKFIVKDIQEPTFIHLRFEGKKTNTAVLLVEAGEEVLIEIDAKNFSQYQVKGSVGSELTQILSNRLAKTVRTLDSLERLLEKTTLDSEREKINLEYTTAIDSQRVFSSRFIIKNAMSRASVMAVYQQLGNNRFVFDRSEDLYLLKVVGTSLKAFYPESDFTKGILADIQNQQKRLTTLRMNQIMEELESSLPEIALPNINGDTIKLSSLFGKIILLDFWTSASQSNLFNNQEYKEIYKTYHTNGFEIYQVSLDNSWKSWAEKVQFTELPWINVCEPNEGSSFAARMYNVTSIPANYLINKNFEIVGKNLYGKELERKIKELI